jgi:hypothetical protein
MTNGDLYRRSHGPKSYCAAQASAFVKLFAPAAINHRSPPASQPKGRPTTGVTTTSWNVAVGSIASVWPIAGYFRSSPNNGHVRPARQVLKVPAAEMAARSTDAFGDRPQQLDNQYRWSDSGDLKHDLFIPRFRKLPQLRRHVRECTRRKGNQLRAVDLVADRGIVDA